MFVRYFVEIPAAFGEVEEALLLSPDRWIPGIAHDADERGGLLLAEVGFGSPPRRLKKEVEIELGEPLRLGSKTLLPLLWRATRLHGLFPVLEGDLEVAALGRSRTQLALSARYQPPLGTFGRAVDRALLHRVAEATVKDFVDRVARAIEPRSSSGSPPAEAAEGATR
jgi:hypothetical protein